MFKISRLQMFFKNIFANFTGVTLVFSCEIYETFNTIFFYRAPPMAAFVCLWTMKYV